LRLICICAGLCLSLAAESSLTSDQRKLNTGAFESVWKTVRDKHWDPTLGGLDWQAVHDELRPKVEKATTMAEAREVIGEMIHRLHQTHFGIIPADVYHEINPIDGGAKDAAEQGATGMDVRVIDGKALVTRVDEGSPAAASGVRPGWIILRIDGEELAPAISRISQSFKDSTLQDLTLSRAVRARLDAKDKDSVQVEFLDGEGGKTQLAIARAPPRGNVAQFGFMPPQHVWIESKKMGNIGYIAFNLFLDPARLFPVFEDAVKSCMHCDGLIIDLRGNPGGIAGIAMGMAGYFVSDVKKELGVIYTRAFPMKCAINPRLDVYEGPLAFLLDGLSASTSEILAGGMKDLHRARIFGTRTAGAALPSTIEMLPNGDGFQYAFANYISNGGKALEGVGVTPDVEVAPTRNALLAGRDPALEAAIQWIQVRKKRVPNEP
jgi:carboxyl-terminal processing protease